MAVPINERFKQIRRIIGGIYRADPVEVEDGDQVALNLDSIGRVKVSCTPFNPVEDGSNSTIAFSTIAARSTQMTIGGIYWIWSTKACYIKFGDSSVDATSDSCRLPPGAVVQYSPTTDRDYVSALRITDTGLLYVSRVA